MQKLWDKIKYMRANRAVHRKGYVMGCMHRSTILAHMKEEVKELEFLVAYDTDKQQAHMNFQEAYRKKVGSK